MEPHSWSRTGRDSYICELEEERSFSIHYHEYRAELVYMDYGKGVCEIRAIYDQDTQEISVFTVGATGLEGIAAQVRGIGTEGLGTESEKTLCASLLSVLLQLR